MSLVEFEPGLLYLGLSLIAVGTGMFKGNVTYLVHAMAKTILNVAEALLYFM
ncbi:MFS transporter [Wolbachia endosymbiont of Delia radicum]|nr:MFS transporter [Wolbachia endosymbiont of Delia radicum]UJQ21697.1 MFS transporter [Wolbachia endosymbiont of Delia radicum]